MQATINIGDTNYTIDLSKPLDLSLPLKNGEENPNCFWAPYPMFEPYKAGSFVGATYTGSPVNFYNVKINPHGNGTHTECVGHIALEKYSIRTCLQQHWFKARLISANPTKMDNGDSVVLKQTIEPLLKNIADCTALIMRTLPNDEKKRTKPFWNYPPYGTKATTEDLQKVRQHCTISELLFIPTAVQDDDYFLNLQTIRKFVVKAIARYT